MISNYKEALEHLYSLDMLNEKGLKEFLKLTRVEIFELREKIIRLESEMSYKGKVRG